MNEFRNLLRKVQNIVYSWPAIERMMRIHRLIENGEYPNCTKMAEEFEMSPRTIKRDVDFMKTRLNLPIAFDVRRNGFFFTKSVPNFPQMPMSEADTFRYFSRAKRWSSIVHRRVAAHIPILWRSWRFIISMTWSWTRYPP